ncbi:diacylglycerol lipase-beta-like isoform X2 [Uloborus diversus]|uniref:diacylglycerol lipase-beta-like isoform X2 n=1 Tax=Uloborus diversus TaxID=327109 RepID=UPI00240948A0|nr:diacylglycerol lipase-beta-like isoform X2 [Uloborus diversus]
MPALVLFGRKWLIACDDLVIPFAVDVFVKIAWLTGTLVLIFQSTGCYASFPEKIFLCLAGGNFLFSSCLSIIISLISSKGSVLQVQKRKSLIGFLYLKFLFLIVDCGLASFGTWILFEVENICTSALTFIKVSTILLWLYIFLYILNIFICYNSLGSSKFWDNNSSSTSQKFFRRAERVWRSRLKFFCCCADIGEENELVYVEISSFLASFLNEVDLVPTDTLAGIISLSAKHSVEKRRKNIAFNLEVNPVILKGISPPSWMTMTNALYFLRIAKSTYGWLAFLKIIHPCSLCRLISPRCCLRSFSSQNDSRLDNCCYCNFSAVQKITGFSESDILYSSFQNCIYEPAFYIVIDHAKKSIVIAIRGTMSFSDLVTDIDAEVQPFPSHTSDSKFKCHRGFLRSALCLQKKINDLGVLETATMENPTYVLVLTGHSLGGSIASLLGLLLKPRYPDLQCYIYAPMAAISSEGIPETLNFVLSVVVGDDAVPCLNTESCKVLRTELIKALEDTDVPKYKILARACWYHIKKRFKKPQKRVLTEVYENRSLGDEEMNSTVNNEGISVLMDSKLYAPGRVIYFDKMKGNEFHWVTGLNFQRICISKTMLADHQPHKIQFMLEQAVKNQNCQTV